MSQAIRHYLNLQAENSDKVGEAWEKLSYEERLEVEDFTEVPDTLIIEEPDLVLSDLNEILASE